MFGSQKSNVTFVRCFFQENVTVTYSDVYLSLAVILGTLYLYYIRVWLKSSSSGSHDGAKATSRESKDPLENCDYANVKVTKLLIHPIKSCRGTSVLEAEYTEEGLEHDRRLAIIDARTHRVITAREFPQMVLIYPQVIIDKRDEYGGRIQVSFPDESGCDTFTVPLNPNQDVLSTWKRLEDVELWGRSDIDGFICQSMNGDDRQAPTRILSQFLGKEVYLILKGPRPRLCPPTHDFPDLKAHTSYQDGYPLLVASEESLLVVQTQLRGEVGRQGVEDRWDTDSLVMERFRPNIVMAGAGIPWAEDFWETIQTGNNASNITLVSKCTRCLLPNVDPETGVRDEAVPYKVLMKFRAGKNPERLSKPCFGCNGVPKGSGIVRVGDSVTVLKTIQR